MAPTDSDNVGVAFALVIGAGAATGIGASVVFFPSLIRLASRKTLAAALGLSAGVMTYVSFAEIFVKGITAFEDDGFSEDDATLYATLCFFGGVVFMITLNHCVTLLLGAHHSHGRSQTVTGKSGEEDDDEDDDNNDYNHTSGQEETEEILPPCPCHDDNPVETLAKVQLMAQEMEEHNQDANHMHKDDSACVGSVPVEKIDMEFTSEENDNELSLDNEKEDDDDEESAGQKKLMNMSLKTALAIGLHNFPEGLATFVAALNDPKVGAVLAVAIAIHNIPEGLCVAMPIYYATGNKWKAFWWAMLSGASEPVAGLLGWLILANSFSDTLYGVLFAMVAGMMVIISVRELLPTAHRYDPEDSVVTNGFIAGMAIMAISLMLFLF